MEKRPNRLIHESSLYLRQHAYNPVDWYPWCEEAFARARAEQKPILLSIGYSACHWCHVMERESFEDPETARLMNQLFVNIKVDREERPDIDQVYMNAVQLLTGRGGWPLTVFLRPDGTPFYGGTYFPPEDRFGLPSFRRVLLAVAQAYRERPDEIDKTAAQILDALRKIEATAAPGEESLDASLLDTATARLTALYDREHGGLRGAPKFPNPSVFEFFLQQAVAAQRPELLSMVRHTLEAMARGGIYDQLGGGFHRYSVDERWLVPHFEKMLYDNALLVPLYLRGFLCTGERDFVRVARETLAYLLREMRHPEGGFYASQDADSEGEEGRFFVWRHDEIQRVLGKDLGELACRYFGVTEVGNFEAGRNVLHRSLTVSQLAGLYQLPEADVESRLKEARRRLFEVRETRVRPARDEKILAAWNGMAVSAFAFAAGVLNDSHYQAVAEAGLRFLRERMWRDGRLLSVYADGQAKHLGHLDDYAFVLTAVLDVFEVSQTMELLDWSQRLAGVLLDRFWDNSAAGFFFTSDEHEALVHRCKPSFDGAVPSGNSVACRALLRLFHWTGEERYRTHAEAMLSAYAPAMRDQPSGFANFLCAASFQIHQPKEIVVVRHDESAEALLRAVWEACLPHRILLVLRPGDGKQALPLAEGKVAAGPPSCAFVCHRMTCSPPLRSAQDLQLALRS